MNKLKKIGIKILLTIAVIVVATVSMAVVSESGNTNSAGVRLIPGAILIFGIIYVWFLKKQK